jgi:arsenate reductase
MADPKLFHNPRCTKSRSAKQLLDDKGVEYEVIEYLKAPPARAQLERIVELIDDPPAKLVRSGDPKFRDLGLSKDDYVDADAVVDLLVEHPELMERPVLLTDDAAAIGRPTEKIADLL